MHSYFCRESESKQGESYTAALCDYYIPFTAAFEKRNMCGLQFHPEKSGEAGLQVLRNWVSHYSGVTHEIAPGLSVTGDRARCNRNSQTTCAVCRWFTFHQCRERGKNAGRKHRSGTASP
ncbi:MAG: hypothetical protein GY765_06450 [bacterium]|nr:hypothetical protein [bacterium]